MCAFVALAQLVWTASGLSLVTRRDSSIIARFVLFSCFCEKLYKRLTDLVLAFCRFSLAFHVHHIILECVMVKHIFLFC